MLITIVSFVSDNNILCQIVKQIKITLKILVSVLQQNRH
jgi:hypothetical protein